MNYVSGAQIMVLIRAIRTGNSCCKNKIRLVQKKCAELTAQNILLIAIQLINRLRFFHDGKYFNYKTGDN